MNILNRSLLLLLSLLPSLAADLKDVATRCLISIGNQELAEARLISTPEVSFAVDLRTPADLLPELDRLGPSQPHWSSLVIERRYDAAKTDWKQWWAEATPRHGSSGDVPVSYLRTVAVTFAAENGVQVAGLRCEGGFPLAYSIVPGPGGSAVERLTLVAKQVTLLPTP